MDDGITDATQGIRIVPGSDLWPVYRGIVRSLRSLGYEVLFFAFDWRKSILSAVEEFDRFVSENAPGVRLNLVTHSMGGLVAALWLAAGNAERLNKMMGIALPVRGVEMTVSNFLLGSSALALFNIRADSKLVRELSWAVPSIYEMLPPLPGIFKFSHWPEELDLSPVYLDRAAELKKQLEAVLHLLSGLGTEGRLALIAGARERMIRWTKSEEKAIDSECAAPGLGDGWALEQSVQIPGVATYAFRRRLIDSIRLGFFFPVALLLGSHPLLPMFHPVRRAVAEFLDSGRVDSLPLHTTS